ncbi:olfactory receptor 13F1-like [Pelodytes ibericus]
MEVGNQSIVLEFYLVGLSQNRRTQSILAVLFSIMYISTLLGNMVLIFAVISNSHIHTPMYYFLCNLSFLDLFYSTSIVPKMLEGLIYKGGGRISFMACMIQMSTSLFLGETECILLAVMAYDRFVAICYPLRYTVIMSWKMCKNIAVVLWLGSFLLSTLPTISHPFSFCKDNKVNHFVCEILAMLKLVCGDTSFYEKTIFFASFFTLLTPFAFIVVSYMFIIISIIKIKSVDGRTKAFSTCTSHLTVVVMFYGTIMSMYLGQKKDLIANQKFVTVIYAIVTPTLNPLIYSLRNNEVKGSVKKLFLKMSLSKLM